MEEMTLYMIEKDKELKDVKTQLNILINEIKTLKNEN